MFDKNKFYILLITILFCHVLQAKITNFSSWEGNWISPKDSFWQGHIEITNCNINGCHYSFSNGDSSSVCESNGIFKFVNNTSAKFIDYSSEDVRKKDKIKDNCLVKFSKYKNKIILDSSGDYCSYSCGGFRGSAGFAGTFRKTK